MADDFTSDELAGLAGFTVAFYKHNSELWRLFKEAKAGDWTGARLLAETRNTNWFRRNSEAERQVAVLKTSDPAEYQRRLTQAENDVTKVVRELGVRFIGFSRDDAAARALAGGWDEAQIRRFVTAYWTVAEDIRAGKAVGGLAGQTKRSLEKLAYDYGIPASNSFFASATQHIVQGNRDINWYREYFTNRAKSTYAGIADDIDSGLTVRQIAEPYIDSMARLWEINPNDIDVRDSTIRKALTSRAKDGNPAPRSIWQFENDLRKSARWKSTNNARESLLDTGHKVLSDLGLVT